MPSDGKSGALLTAEHDTPFLYIFADVFEADGRFQNFALVESGNAIDEMRRRDGPRHAAGPVPAFDKVVDQHRNQFIRIDEFSAFVEHSESIRIPVRGKSEFQPIVFHDGLQLAELLIGGFRLMAAEVHVACCVKRHDRNVFLPKQTIEIARARPMQRVVSKAEIGGADLFEIDFCREIAKVSGTNIEAFNQRIVRLCRELPVRPLELDDLFFDFRSDLGKGRRTIGSRKFQTVVFARIMAGGNVDCAVQLIVHNREGHCRGRYSL